MNKRPSVLLLELIGKQSRLTGGQEEGGSGQNPLWDGQNTTQLSFGPVSGLEEGTILVDNTGPEKQSLKKQNRLFHGRDLKKVVVGCYWANWRLKWGSIWKEKRERRETEEWLWRSAPTSPVCLSVFQFGCAAQREKGGKCGRRSGKEQRVKWGVGGVVTPELHPTQVVKHRHDQYILRIVETSRETQTYNQWPSRAVQTNNNMFTEQENDNTTTFKMSLWMPPPHTHQNKKSF